MSCWAEFKLDYEKQPLTLAVGLWVGPNLNQIKKFINIDHNHDEIFRVGLVKIGQHSYINCSF